MTLSSDQDKKPPPLNSEAVVHWANFAMGCLASAPDAYAARFDLAHAIVHVLDDLWGSVDAGFFSEGFHEGMVLHEVENNFESCQRLTVRLTTLLNR